MGTDRVLSIRKQVPFCSWGYGYDFVYDCQYLVLVTDYQSPLFFFPSNFLASVCYMYWNEQPYKDKVIAYLLQVHNGFGSHLAGFVNHLKGFSLTVE